MALPLHHARILPEWIDFNGHLRDAYYTLILSLAVDEAMDVLGMDAAYRKRTGCTLYSLELHMHYLHEVKADDSLAVESSVLAADAKRLHLGCRFLAAGRTVATGDVMLLHVHQGTQPASAPFPADILRRLEPLILDEAAGAAWGPRSRPIEMKRRGAPA